VAEYRAYTIGIDGHFVGDEPLICDNDDDAVSKASSLVDGHDIELWSGERLVVLLKHRPKELNKSMSGTGQLHYR
jgi:broad-specificity NMP kinase